MKPKPLSALASQCCKACGSHHVLTTVSSNGRKLGEFWCGNCGTFFDSTV